MKKSFFLFLPILMLFLLIPLAQGTANYDNTDFHFGFGTGSYINFSAIRTFTTHPYKGADGYWYFDSYGFQVTNANMTITQFFTDDKLIFDLTATTGTTSTTNIYLAGKGEPTKVLGATTWGYNPTTNIITISVTHASPETLEIIWYVAKISFLNIIYVSLPILALIPLIMLVMLAIAVFQGGGINIDTDYILVVYISVFIVIGSMVLLTFLTILGRI